jgi:hypothetical protein
MGGAGKGVQNATRVDACDTTAWGVTGFILAAELTNQTADAPQLIGLVDQAIQNTRVLPAELSADAARLHGGGIAEPTARGIDV